MPVRVACPSFSLLVVGLVACASSQRAGPAADAPGARRAGRDRSPTYPIRILRPAHVGDHFPVVIEAHRIQRREVTVAGEAPREDHSDVRIHFEAVETVASVNSVGKPVRSEFAVSHFQRTDENGTREVLQPGSSIVLGRAREARETTLTAGGAPASEEVFEAMFMTMPFTASEVSDDDVFGTRAPQIVGASWPVDGDLLDRVTARPNGFDVHSTGTSQLTRHVEIGPVEALEVTSTVRTAIASMPNLPHGATFREGSTIGEFHSVLPLDPEAHLIRTDFSIEMRFVIDVPSPSGATARVRSSDTIHQETVYGG